jgi:hypothetical protein
MWEKLKKDWHESKTLSELNAEAAKSPEAKARIEEQLKSQVAGAHAAGSAVLDTLGAVPAMAVGGIAGVGSAVKNLDASKGLETGGKVMNALMPSSLLGHEEDQKHGAYKAAMAPVTVAADAFNAVPQGYGEIVNAAGFPKAAAQVTDAGKLGIMAVLGAKGTVEMYKHVTGKEAKNAKEAADKLQKLLDQETKAKAEPQWEKVTSASDRGIPPTEENPQGQLWSQEHDTPTNPIPSDNQMGLFDRPAEPLETIPYDLSLGDIGQNHPGLRMGEFTKRADDGPQPKTKFADYTGELSMEEFPNRLDQDQQGRQAAPPNSWEQGPVGSRDVARAKAEERARLEQHATSEKQRIEREKQAAFDYIEQMNKANKERDLNHMEAQRELDFADATSRIEQSPARNFFTDPNNREKAVRPEDSHARSFFLDPANRDRLDLQDANPFLKRATDEHLERLHADAYSQWSKSGGKDTHAEKFMDAVQQERVRRSVESLRAENKDKVNEVHPGYTRIPDGTIVEYKYKGETHRAPVEKSTTVKTAYGTTHIPRVFSPEGRLIALDKDQIKTVFGKPKSVERDHSFAQEAVGDKSLMHPEHTEVMVDALHKGDVNGALDAIIQNHDNVAYRNLASYLKGKLEGLNIRMHDEGILTLGDRHATGYYDPTTHTVGLSSVGAASPHTVMHELAHALTSDFVNNRPNDMRVVGIKDLFNKLNDLGMQKEFPEVSNIKEFMAEAWSSPEFQEFLKDHNVGDRSAWKRFVNNVKSILGFSSTDRNHITTALEHVLDLSKQIMEAGKDDPKAPLTDAGVPGKLADLMVSRNSRPEPSNRPDVTKLKVPGLKDAISDFKFDDRPMEEIIKEARTSPDIPNTFMEKLGQQLQAGGLFESLKTRNPVVKATYERLTRASQEYAHNIKTYLTDPETGLKAYMRNLNAQEKGEIHKVMMKFEGQRELSTLELRNAGYNDKQIAYYHKAREQDNRFFDEMNARRKELGMDPIDKRVAHMAGRFMGDFSRFIFSADGKKIVGRISGSTHWELNKVTKYMQDKHPDFKMGDMEYNKLGQGKNPADRFQGLMHALNFLTKVDADVASVLDSYRGYVQKDAIGYLNATRHAKAKVKDAGGIIGSEGHKEWLSDVKNAEEGMKAQLAYFEQGYKWMAMEKAVHDLKPLLTDKDVVLNNKNAVEWAEAYKAHALGKQEFLANAMNFTASMIGEHTGIGHTNLFKANAKLKHYTMQKFMGFGNIPFSITQLMQPFQVHPPMLALLKNRGLEFSAVEAQMKATRTYLNAISKEYTGKLGNFDKAALDYAHRAGIMDVKMADHTKDINASAAYELYSKVADANIELPERLTRGTSFLFYSHILKDAGVPVKDIFGAAENLTNMTMVNYHPLERPMGYAKLGWLGDIASTLTRYKHNQLSQAAFYTREGIRSGNVKGYAPMATFLATSLAFGGVMGFFGYNEADTAYQLVTEMLGKPDTLTGVLFRHNTPELVSHGLFSTLGLDMTTRFSNANVIPDNIGKAMMPYGSAVWDMLTATGRLAMDPSSTTKQKQWVKSVAPQSVQGELENLMFTEKQKDGSNLYVNGTAGPNMGKGRVARTEDEMYTHIDGKAPFVHPGRDLGFRSIRESKELAKNYSDSQIEKANANVVEGILTKAKYAAMDGTLSTDKLRMLATRAAQLGEDPNSFAAKLSNWEGARNLTQEQQQKLRDAMSGFKGAMNIKEGR